MRWSSEARAPASRVRDAEFIAQFLSKYGRWNSPKYLFGESYGTPRSAVVAFTAAELPALRQDQEAALYRVAQEALHNALQHSGAATVRVRLARSARRVILEVGDDGHGFTPQAPSGGVGLASMRQRATAAGGTLSIKSGATGTMVKMTVPIGSASKKRSDQWPSAC